MTSPAIEALPPGITSTIDLIPVAVLVVEKDGRAVGSNAAWRELTGLDRQASIGWGWSSVLAPKDQDNLLDNLVASDPRGNPALGDYPLRIAGGFHWSRWTARCLTDEHLHVMAVVDIDADHARAEALRRAATLDSLTGLVNRAELLQLTAEALGRDPAAVGMCYVDLDAFKTVNDSGGHLLGDRVLAAVAARLAAAVRPGDVVARVGGDEFAVLLADGAHASAIAGRLNGALADPILAGGVEWHVGATVGLARGERSQTAEELLAAADQAMYAAKAASRQPATVRQTATAGVVAIPSDAANDLIQQIFSIGLTLASTSEMADGVVAERLAGAVDDLDRVITWMRKAGIETVPPAAAELAEATHEPIAPAGDPLVKQISLLLNQLEHLSDAATRVDGQSSIHLLDASHSMHRSLIDLTAHLAGDDTSSGCIR